MRYVVEGTVKGGYWSGESLQLNSGVSRRDSCMIFLSIRVHGRHISSSMKALYSSLFP